MSKKKLAISPINKEKTPEMMPEIQIEVNDNYGH